MPPSIPRLPLRASAVAVAFTCLGSMHVTAVLAQPVAVRDSITQGAQADRAIEETRERLIVEQTSVYDVGQDPGVYVLIEQDIFSVGIDVGLGYSSDVDKGDLDAAQSTYTSFSVNAGVDTRIDDSFNAGARIALSQTLFHDEVAFNSAALIGSVYVSEPFFDDTLILTADATGGLNGGYDFDNGSSYLNTSLRAARPIAFGRSTVLIPSVSAGLVYAEQSEQDRWEVGAQLRLVTALMDELRLAVSAGVTYAEYDNFYEDVLLVGRQDTTSYVAASLDYQITENLTASANVRYTNRTSTLDIVEYEEIDASVMLGLTARF